MRKPRTPADDEAAPRSRAAAAVHSTAAVLKLVNAYGVTPTQQFSGDEAAPPALLAPRLPRIRRRS